MADENLKFPIPKEIIEPFIREATATAIVAALGDGTALIEKAVTAALSQKVDSKGEKNRYDSDNRYVFAEIMAMNKIQSIAKEVINEMGEQMRPKIREQIEKQLKTKHSLIAKTLVNGLIESLTSQWAVKIVMSRE